MKWKMSRLFTMRAALILLAVVVLLAQAVILSADTANTPAASDQAPHKGSRNLKHAVADGKPQATTSPLSLQVVEIIGTDGKRTTTYPDGTVITLIPGADPRWSMQSPLDASFTIGTPAGLTYTKLQARAVTLSDPNDPLSLVSITDTVTTNGRATTNVYTAASRTLASTSSAGRQSSMLLDTQSRLSSLQIPGLATRQFTYDNQGRPAAITQGSGSDTRTLTFNYNPQGFLNSITDPLMRIVTFDRDLTGRVTRQTLPDGREIRFT
jgi:YD repeat-containing protein